MNKINLYLLTGYLGAGKTTFLKSLIKTAPERKIGIIMNEFGKVGIDGELVEDTANELIEINRGSIFCSCLKLSFVESLKDMSERPIDTLFVEGSGLADPSNIGEILEATEILIGERYHYAGAICVVDAKNFETATQEHETIQKQLIHSHLAVISKSDLVGDLTDVQTRIKQYNPNIAIASAVHGQLDFDFFKSWQTDVSIIKDETLNTTENKPKTLSLEIYEPVDKDALDNFLKAISMDAYRLKGFVKRTDGFFQVDVVNGHVDYEACEDKEQSQLVIISKIGPQIIRKIIPLWDSTVSVEYKLKN